MIYIESDDASVEQPVKYVLIRIQVPFQGTWPSGSELFIDGKQVTLGPVNRSFDHFFVSESFFTGER